MTDVKKSSKNRVWTICVIAPLILLAALGAVYLLILPALRVAHHDKMADTESQIIIACYAYYAEYGSLPEVSENGRLMKILGGENPRAIGFINLQSGQLNANGEMIDPWRTPFRITFDPDSKVHVISAGPDKIFGTPDDITNQ
jgi:hypothetical protein